MELDGGSARLDQILREHRAKVVAVGRGSKGRIAAGTGPYQGSYLAKVSWQTAQSHLPSASKEHSKLAIGAKHNANTSHFNTSPFQTCKNKGLSCVLENAVRLR